MMNIYVSCNLPSWYAKIISLISNDNLFPNVVPFTSVIELLIQIPCITKQFFANFSIQAQVFPSLLQCPKFNKITVASKFIKTSSLEYTSRSRLSFFIVNNPGNPDSLHQKVLLPIPDLYQHKQK